MFEWLVAPSRSSNASHHSPIVVCVGQLPNGNGELGLFSLQQLLQPHQALVCLVDDGERLPAPSFHNIHVGL